MTNPLDRLRVELPGDWQPVEPSEGKAWYADPARTVYLQIGEQRLFVSARARGALAGPIGAAQRSIAWRDLRRSICEGAARIAVDHAREGKAIPPLPTWATPALVSALANRGRILSAREAKAHQDLTAIAAERALLSTLTLGA